MTRKAHGVLRQNTVVLDEPIPELEGCRVEVELWIPSEHDEKPATELLEAWRSWAASGGQGAIVDEQDGWE